MWRLPRSRFGLVDARKDSEGVVLVKSFDNVEAPSLALRVSTFPQAEEWGFVSDLIAHPAQLWLDLDQVRPFSYDSARHAPRLDSV